MWDCCSRRGSVSGPTWTPRSCGDRDIVVGSIPAAAWGILVFLIAIVFGILYLILRPRAIRRAALGP